MKRPFFSLLFFCLSVGVLSTSPVTAAGKPKSATFTPLTIVLTNDDGYNDVNLGIQTLAGVLKTAGHTVYIVAPASRVDGCSFAIDSPELTISCIETPYLVVVQQADAFPGVPTWSVSTTSGPPFTPGQSAFSVPSLAQFPFILPPDVVPDLVISGINIEDNNTGPAVLGSGTVAAAEAAFARVFAHFEAVPAIAVSGPGEAFGSNFSILNTPISEFVLSLITELQSSKFARKTGKLLPDFVGLNVNWPATETPNGVRITRQGLVAAYNTSGIPEGGSYTVIVNDPTVKVTVPTPPDGLVPMPVSERYDIPDSDTLAVFQGYIAITPISPFLSVSKCEWRYIKKTLCHLQPTGRTAVPNAKTSPKTKSKKSGKYK